MDRRNVLSLSAITVLGLSQQAADVDGVKAASEAFYAALAVLATPSTQASPPGRRQMGLDPQGGLLDLKMSFGGEPSRQEAHPQEFSRTH
jgi:hypothetical protein